MVISFARDAALYFIYENTLIRLYALSHDLRFFSLLDNECPDESTDIIVLPGGYPELYANKFLEATKFSVYLRRIEAKATVKVYAECGGFLVLSQFVFNDESSWLMLGVLNIINLLAPPTLKLYKYCLLFGSKRGMFFGHEFHYYNEMSRSNYNYVYLAKVYDELRLEGANVNNVLGGYIHCIGSIR
ncbi:MAG: hypothetical protein AAJB65_00335 [Candidatus Hodgkinia cicadicola]